MLCASKAQLGLFGASYFIGVIVATTLIPVGYLSDIYGRKWVFVASIAGVIVACIGLLLATKIEHLFVFLFMLGLSHPGRSIVAISYADEFLHKEQNGYLVPLNQIVNGLFIIGIAFYF